MPLPRRLPRTWMYIVPLVCSGNPCLCASRLPALSIDGASQNVQVARRPAVCRGNWLSVALFSGKSTHLFIHTPDSHRRRAKCGGGQLTSRYLLLKIEASRFGSEILFILYLFIFSLSLFTSAVTETADWCLIGAKPDHKVTSGSHMLIMPLILSHTKGIQSPQMSIHLLFEIRPFMESVFMFLSFISCHAVSTLR